ncbi:hypothetical protein INT43_008015 [Umbelopsis isabellina]|uniref:Uncharacterized protein n=1 Tax=Mortierella isabellina TaxID=91625 RepID=A0A8H7PP38_MORIS|nr:hypothetical protein INT43_008015 [Umbelopsis isabellina]
MNSNTPTQDDTTIGQSHYNRALWEWTNNQLKQARRKSDEDYVRRSGYKPRTHQQQQRQATATQSSSCVS